MDYFITSEVAFITEYCEDKDIVMYDIKRFHDQAYTVLICIKNWKYGRTIRLDYKYFKYIDVYDSLTINSECDQFWLDYHDRTPKGLRINGMAEMAKEIRQRLKMTMEQLMDRYFYPSDDDNVILYKDKLLNTNPKTLGEGKTIQDVLDLLGPEADTPHKKRVLAETMIYLTTEYVRVGDVCDLTDKTILEIMGTIR